MANIKPDPAENRLKAVLTEQKQTCRWLAEQIGKNENTVSRWRLNKIQLSAAQFGEIAHVLGVDVRSLLKPTKKNEKDF